MCSMEKASAVFMAAILLVAPAAADDNDDSIDININLDFNLFGGDEDDDSSEDEENQTYGERVGGQSVHTDEQDSEAEVGRDSDDFQITEDTDNDSGFLSNLLGMIGLS